MMARTMQIITFGLNMLSPTKYHVIKGNTVKLIANPISVVWKRKNN